MSIWWLTLTITNGNLFAEFVRDLFGSQLHQEDE